MTNLGFVTGLRAEARLLAGASIAIGGGTPVGARAAAERLVAGGAGALVSFGLAGGLDPALAAGVIVVPRAVLVDGVHHETAPGLVGGITHDLIVQTDRVLATVAQKRAVFAATGAVAVDLESGAVAQVAATHGLPFAVLRAICDPAGRDLPPAALAALDTAGAIGLLRVLTSLLRHPLQLPALLRLAGDAALARRALVGAIPLQTTAGIL
jgi:adenosylhomocysteine nucleosidase